MKRELSNICFFFIFSLNNFTYLDRNMNSYWFLFMAGGLIEFLSLSNANSLILIHTILTNSTGTRGGLNKNMKLFIT